MVGAGAVQKKKVGPITEKTKLKTGDASKFWVKIAIRLANKRTKILKSALKKIRLLDQVNLLKSLVNCPKSSLAYFRVMLWVTMHYKSLLQWDDGAIVQKMK